MAIVCFASNLLLPSAILVCLLSIAVEAAVNCSSVMSPFFQCHSTFMDLRSGHDWCLGSDGRSFDMTAALAKPPCPRLPKGGSVPTYVPPTYITRGLTTAFLRRYCGKKQAIDIPKLVAPTYPNQACSDYPFDMIYCNLGDYLATSNCTYTNTTSWGPSLAFASLPDPKAWRPFIDCGQAQYMGFLFTFKSVSSNAGGFTCFKSQIRGLPVGMDISVSSPGYVTINFNRGGKLYGSFSNQNLDTSCCGFPCPCAGNCGDKGYSVNSFDVFEYDAPTAGADVLASAHSVEFCATTASTATGTVTIYTRIY